MRFRRSRSGVRVDLAFDDGGMNLLSSEALVELSAVVEQARLDTPAASVLVFSSARPGLFAAGADMGEMRQFTAADAEAFSRQGQELFARIEALPMLTVALIDGDCFGGALDLAMAFDLRLATPRSRFAHPGARLGIVTGFGGTSRWRRLLSRPAANIIFLGGDAVPADDALRIGLVDRVSTSHEAELARLESKDPLTVTFIKELARHADQLTRSQLVLMADRLGHLYFGGSPWNR